MIERELDCRTVFFWNVGISCLLLGREPTYLINLIRTYRNLIQNLDVYINGSSVNLVYKVVYVPLVYSRLTEMSMTREQKKSRVGIPVLSHFYIKFQEYNLLANADNLNNYLS